MDDQEKSFAYCLASCVELTDSVDDTTRHQVMYVLGAKDSLRKRIAIRILHKRADAYVREQGLVGATEAIDWSKIPWEQIIVGLLKVLLVILPFIL